MLSPETNQNLPKQTTNPYHHQEEQKAFLKVILHFATEKSNFMESFWKGCFRLNLHGGGGFKNDYTKLEIEGKYSNPVIFPQCNN